MLASRRIEDHHQEIATRIQLEGWGEPWTSSYSDDSQWLVRIPGRGEASFRGSMSHAASAAFLKVIGKAHLTTQERLDRMEFVGERIITRHEFTVSWKFEDGGEGCAVISGCDASRLATSLQTLLNNENISNIATKDAHG